MCHESPPAPPLAPLDSDLRHFDAHVARATRITGEWRAAAASGAPVPEQISTLDGLAFAVVRLRAALRAERAATERLQDAAYALGMMGLQSERYQRDHDFRDAVDDALALAPRLPRAALSGPTTEEPNG